jgi:dihydroorotate dehydrogenase (fumarate)
VAILYSSINNRKKKIMTCAQLIPGQTGFSIVVSACPVANAEFAEMEEQGAGAVVLFSLFEEQIRAEAAKYASVRNATSHMFAEASDFFPDLENYATGTEEYLEKIWAAKAEVDIPVIASLNGITSEGWIEYSRQIGTGRQMHGDQYLFHSGDVHVSASEVEHRYLNIITEVRNTVKIPVAVKLNPYFSSTEIWHCGCKKAGADGLVLFNRFYQPDFDIH